MRTESLLRLTLAWTILAAPPALSQHAELPRHLVGARHIVLPQARVFDIEQRRPGIRIERVEANVSIDERVATTHLEIHLLNRSPRLEEGVLLLPVPQGAVVGAFGFDGGSAESTAKILPAAEARRIYDSIVAEIRDPALLEFAGYNLVRSSVFPVPAQGKQCIRLDYEQILSAGDGSRVDYLLPRGESFAQGAPWRIQVRIQSQHEIAGIYSPTHELRTRSDRNGAVEVSVAPQSRNDPGPFRLSYLHGGDGEDEGIVASVFTYPDPSSGGGYFLLIAGLDHSLSVQALQREITLVLDCSGSMTGDALRQAKTAALRVIADLDPGERFNIVAYSNQAERFAPEALAASANNRARARRYLEQLLPHGGTNIHDALVEAMLPRPERGLLPIVLFLTDGRPTVGRTAETTIRELATKGNRHGRRIYTFGVGADVNVPLLDRIAESSRGAATFSAPGADLEQALDEAFRRLQGPVLVDLRLDTPSAGPRRRNAAPVADLMPARLPDLYQGDQLILLGRYLGNEAFDVDIAGDHGGDEHLFCLRIDPRGATTRNAFVPRLWAARRIAALEDEIRHAGADREHTEIATLLDRSPYKELVAEIVGLSTEFGILSEYTAFLATEGTDLADREQLLEESATLLAGRAMAERSGPAALAQSFNLRTEKKRTKLNYRNQYLDDELRKVDPGGVRQVADRAFFRRSGRWVESKLLELPRLPKARRVLSIGTPEHSALAHRLAKEGRQGLLSLPGDTLLDIEGELVLVKNQ